MLPRRDLSLPVSNYGRVVQYLLEGKDGMNEDIEELDEVRDASTRTLAPVMFYKSEDSLVNKDFRPKPYVSIDPPNEIVGEDGVTDPHELPFPTDVPDHSKKDSKTLKGPFDE